MRILVVSPFQPHPDADHGGAVYLGSLIAALQHQAEVSSLHFAHRGELPPLPGLLTFTVPRTRNPDLTAAELWRQRLRLAVDWGLRGLPLVAAKHRSAAFRRELGRVVAETRPDVVLVEFAVMAQYLPDIRGVKTCFTDHEAGESLPARLGPGNLGRRRDRVLWRRYVRRYYPMADLCQALNPDDAAHLTELIGRPVQVRPALVDVPPTAVDPAATEPVLLFLGNYLHHPNPESVQVLAEQVLPRVRQQLPGAKLWLAGPNAPAAVVDLARHQGVEFLGFVEDLPGLLGRARCLLAPMFSGSGVRIKVIQAMAHGLPVVSNRLGLQGVEPPAAAVGIGEDPDALATECLRFLTDPAAAAAAGARARQFIQQTMSGDILVQQQLARIRALA